MFPPLLRLTPFAFDHGKDSIAILSMLATGTPKLIGPWTSIPGVFFGPGWYYLLAPAYALSSGDPASAIWILVGISLFQSLMVWKVWGLRAAVLVTLAPLYIITATSAWNPFPMTLLTFILLAISWSVARERKIAIKWALLLGGVAGLGFHFSAAFAIFYVPFALAVPLLFTAKKRIVTVLSVIVGISLTFVPQLFFELRHSFVQTKALMAYFSAGEPHVFSLAKIVNVISVTFKEISLGIFPVINSPFPFTSIINQVLILVLAPLYGVLIFQWWKHSVAWQKKWLISACVFLLLIPIVGFFFLHFNVWYVYGMAPVLTVLVGLGLSKTSRRIAVLIVGIFISISAWNIYNYLSFEVPQHRLSGGMLSVKEQALASIIERAQGRPFAIYTYVPDIYDFSYQYLWFRRAYQGKGDVPVDFSYKPQTSDYITDKPALLTQFPPMLGQAELVFYLIERPENPEYLEQWWGAQQPGIKLDEYLVGTDIQIVVTKVKPSP